MKGDLINVIRVLLVIAILIGVAQVASGDDSEITNITTINNAYNYTTNQTDVRKAIAQTLGASAVDCSFTNKKTQIGLGIGTFEGVYVPVVSGCRRVKDTLIKLTGSKDGGSIGFMFKLE